MTDAEIFIGDILLYLRQVLARRHPDIEDLLVKTDPDSDECILIASGIYQDSVFEIQLMVPQETFLSAGGSRNVRLGACEKFSTPIVAFKKGVENRLGGDPIKVVVKGEWHTMPDAGAVESVQRLADVSFNHKGKVIKKEGKFVYLY